MGKVMSSSLLGTAKLNSQELQFAHLTHEEVRNNNNNSRRGKFNIIAEILLFCEREKTKTNIIYNANLNYS